MSDKIIIAIVSDMHANSTVGLCTPVFALDDGGTYEASTSQRWLWGCWLNYWQKVKAYKNKGYRVIGVSLGDAVDDNRHSHYQMITDNEADIVDLGEQVLKPALRVCDSFYIIRGTEAHVGGSGYLEEILARRINAVPDKEAGTHSWWCLQMNAGKLRIAAAHHPGTNSMRPWTQGGGANRAAQITMSAYYGEQWVPQLAVFAHVHHNEDSYDNHPVRAIFNRSFSLYNAYDHRGGRSLVRPRVGGLIVRSSGNGYAVEKVRYAVKRKKIVDV